MNGQQTDGLYGALIVDDGGAEVQAAMAAAGAAVLPIQPAASEWLWLHSDWYNLPLCMPNCTMPMAPFWPNNGQNTLLSWFLSPSSGGMEPTADYMALNGFTNAPISAPAVFVANASGPPQYVRFINAAGISQVNISVDGMPLLIVEIDGTTVQPLPQPWVVVNVAQRVSFLLDWSQLHATFVAAPSIRFRIVHVAMDMPADLHPVRLLCASLKSPALTPGSLCTHRASARARFCVTGRVERSQSTSISTGTSMASSPSPHPHPQAARCTAPWRQFPSSPSSHWGFTTHLLRVRTL